MLSYTPPQNYECMYDSLERTASPEFRKALSYGLGRAVKSNRQSRYLEYQDQFDSLQQRLVDLHTLESNWNSYGAPAPTVDSIKQAGSVLGNLRGRLTQPERVLPSADGGVSFVFVGKGINRAAVETLNDGTSFVLLYDTMSRSSTIEFSGERTSMDQAFDRLVDHLQGRELGPTEE